MPSINCRPITVLFLSLLVTACATQQATRPANAFLQYCDSYFVYDMCAKDHDGDGVVDYMYFEDTNEIFMAMPDFQQPEATGRPAHRCLQTMDQPMQTAANALLNIHSGTSNLAKTQIKSRLLLSYSRYMAAVNRCNGTELAADEGSFGDGEF